MNEMLEGNKNQLNKIALIGENKSFLEILFKILHNYFLVDYIDQTSSFNNDLLCNYDLIIIDSELLKKSYIKSLLANKIFITCFENYDPKRIDYAISLNTQDVLVMPFNQLLVLNRVNNILNSKKIQTVFIPQIEDLNSKLELEINQQELLAKISNEIQFKYIYKYNTLKLSTLGEKLLDVTDSIVNPQDNEKLLSIFSRETFYNLINLIRNTSIEKPSISIETKVSVNNKYHWIKIICHSLFDKKTKQISEIIGKIVDITKQQEHLQTLKHRAMIDSLTTLFNHETAKHMIINTMKERPDTNYILIIFDLDNFKNINDTFGHQFGDEVLHNVGRTLRKCVRSSDICARIGGDEFLIFFEDHKNRSQTIKRIFDALCKPFKGFEYTISMGIVESSSCQNTDYPTLFNCADKALYQAKNIGKKRICYYSLSHMDNL